jgi:hypothetical protein
MNVASMHADPCQTAEDAPLRGQLWVQVLTASDDQPAAVQWQFSHDLLPAVCGYKDASTVHIYLFSSTGDLLWLQLSVTGRAGTALLSADRDALARVPMQPTFAACETAPSSYGAPHSHSCPGVRQPPWSHTMVLGFYCPHRR